LTLLHSREQQDEDWFSAATLVARNIRNPAVFDGDLTYDSDGFQTGGWSVEVFAPGMRNPFDIVFHSNGKLYGTDNGPNKGFGNESIACNMKADDPYEPDELNLIQEGKYFGHPNRLRGSNGDSRQCVYRRPSETTTESYSAPIAKLPSSYVFVLFTTLYCFLSA
jgi:glucose/arabinose dehydrogenase